MKWGGDVYFFFKFFFLHPKLFLKPLLINFATSEIDAKCVHNISCRI